MQTNLMSFAFELEPWKLLLEIRESFFWKYPDAEGEKLAVVVTFEDATVIPPCSQAFPNHSGIDQLQYARAGQW